MESFGAPPKNIEEETKMKILLVMLMLILEVSAGTFVFREPNVIKNRKMMIEMSDAEYTISMLSYKKYSKVIVDFPDITVGSIRKVSILVDDVEFLEMKVDAFEYFDTYSTVTFYSSTDIIDTFLRNIILLHINTITLAFKDHAGKILRYTKIDTDKNFAYAVSSYANTYDIYYKE